MLATLIISVYKNCADLRAILHALELQSSKAFEVIVSEDGQSQEIVACLKDYKPSYKIIHLTQEDKGFRKTRALNNALKAANGEYVIFIDGDCVPNEHFIEEHLKHAEQRKIVTGRRAMLGPKMSQLLRDMDNIKKFTGQYIRNVVKALKDGTRFYEDGIYIGWDALYRFISKRRKVRGILGCNFSCYKDALVEINGFDQDYEKPGVGEDTDIDWRFKKIGYSFKSVRNKALVYHLDHPRSTDNRENDGLLAEKLEAGQVQCLHGLETLKSEGK